MIFFRVFVCFLLFTVKLLKCLCVLSFHKKYVLHPKVHGSFFEIGFCETDNILDDYLSVQPAGVKGKGLFALKAIPAGTLIGINFLSVKH